MTMLSIAVEALKYLIPSGIGMVVWGRLVLVRVTAHAGYIFDKPARPFPISEIFARGGDPNSIIVVPGRPKTEPPTVAIASAFALEDVPEGVPTEQALFIRVINRSPDRDVTLAGVWIETADRRIPVDVLGGQITIKKGRRWEGWIRLSVVREAFPAAQDYYSSVRVRVAEKRKTLRSVQADPDEIAPTGELTLSG